MYYSVRLLLLLLIVSVVDLFSQRPGDVIWTKYYGGSNYDEAVSVVKAHDEGYVFVGTTFSYGLDRWANAFIGKTTSTGDSVWTFNFGGDGMDVLNNVIQTSDGNYLAIGLTDSKDQFEQVYLVKFNDFGDTLWTKTYGGATKDIPYSVVETEDQGFMIGALTNSFGAGSEDIWLLRTNSSGDTLWTKTYGTLYQDAAYGLCKTSDGGFALTGVLGSYNLLVMRINSAGDTLWTRSFTGDHFQEGNSIIEASNGNLMVLGHTSSYGAGELDIYLLGLSPDGDLKFAKTFGTPDYEEGRDIMELNSNEFIIAGNNSFPTYVMSYLIISVDSLGEEKWSKILGDPSLEERCYGLLNNGDGYFVIAGANSVSGGREDATLTLVRGGIETGVQDNTSADVHYRLLNAYPNPFNPSTKISYTVPEAGNVVLKVYDVLGKEVAELVNDFVNPGTHTVTFNTSEYNLSSGIYFYTIKAGNFTRTKKLLLMK